MKNLYVIVILFWCGININAQSPDWDWAQSAASGATNSIATGISADASGYVYTTGFFYSPTITFGATTITNTGSSSLFVVKYDSSGNVIWANGAGGTGANSTRGISTDASGNVFTTGSFTNNAIIFGNDTLINTGWENFFITKYNSSGNVLWAKRAGQASGIYPGIDERGAGVCPDAFGNVYVTGFFETATIVFGNYTLYNSDSEQLATNVFLVKYDSTGTVVWAKNAGQTNAPIGGDISVDINGNVYITGVFSSNTISIGGITLTNSGVQNIFVAKYDPLGYAVWAKRAGGLQTDYVGGISTDTSGNVYITGSFSSYKIAFGNDTLTNADGKGTSDIFAAKYDSSGNVLWVNRAGGIKNDYGEGIRISPDNNVFVTGEFENNVAFGNYTLTDASADTTDIFIVKYTSDGNVVWAKSAGGKGFDYSNKISLDGEGNSYVTGYFYSPEIAFGNNTLMDTGTDNFDYFIAKLGNEAVSGIITETQSLNAITVFPNPSTSTFNFTGLPTGSTIRLYNILGEIIYSSIANSDNYTINLSNQAKGVYFYRATDNSNDVQQGKIILQ